MHSSKDKDDERRITMGFCVYGPKLIEKLVKADESTAKELAILLGLENIALQNNNGENLLGRILDSKLDVRKKIAILLKPLYPKISSCGRCQMPWICASWHSTSINTKRGVFPLCQNCWEELKKPKKRLPYYKELFNESGDREYSWEDVKKAVMAGL